MADLKQCPLQLLTALRAESCMPQISALVTTHGLTELGIFSHNFDLGFTGLIALAESHIAIHTWPKEQYVSLNIHVCNYSADNSAKARLLFQDITQLFHPSQVEYQEIKRSFN